MVECLLSHRRPWVRTPGMVVYAYNPSTGEVEVG